MQTGFARTASSPRRPGPPKPLEELAEELGDLAEKGYAEVVLAGINLTAYGQEWGGSPLRRSGGRLRRTGPPSGAAGFAGTGYAG